MISLSLVEFPFQNDTSVYKPYPDMMYTDRVVPGGDIKTCACGMDIKYNEYAVVHKYM